jgi:hypothetical protein
MPPIMHVSVEGVSSAGKFLRITVGAPCLR